MKRLPATLIGLALVVATAAVARGDEDSDRSGYSYVRETSGDVSIVSRYNGRVAARRNLPITAGDEIEVSEAGRAEVALADGNVLYVGGGTHARFVSLADQQGDQDDFSAIQLVDGSVVLFAAGRDQNQIPRIDTDDATVYLNSGARARVNADSRRGTVVIGRAGNAEVRTRAGSFRLRPGEFLEVQGDQEPEIERGAFSRDRFDIWVADRIESGTETRSASARYVDDQYAGDVAAMDGYGNWQYNDEYGTDVWSPNVDADWTPYSDGSWYYTPAGMTWWSYDPWGWVPFHYGSWCFSSSWNRWCWRPASVYSPAWVYWAYTPSFVGWCPIGSYSFWSPWYDNYYHRLGWFNRNNVYISMRGVFSPRSVDFRGWNFIGARGFGTSLARGDVIPGARIGDRLGAASVAISSRPMVVNARPGEAREAIQNFVREAPRRIAGSTSAAESARFAPILARQRTLPAATLEAVQQHAVVTDRGRLAGPGVADVAPRGARVEPDRSLSEIARQPLRPAPRIADRSGAAAASAESTAPSRPQSDWRSRSFEPGGQDNSSARLDRGGDAATSWRGRPGNAAPPVESAPAARAESSGNESWRTRPEVPPARRVIEGAVPGRATRPSQSEHASRSEFLRSPGREPESPAAVIRSESRGREYRQGAPAPRIERAPAPRAAAPRSAPSRGQNHRNR